MRREILTALGGGAGGGGGFSQFDFASPTVNLSENYGGSPTRASSIFRMWSVGTNTTTQILVTEDGYGSDEFQSRNASGEWPYVTSLALSANANNPAPWTASPNLAVAAHRMDAPFYGAIAADGVLFDDLTFTSFNISWGSSVSNAGGFANFPGGFNFATSLNIGVSTTTYPNLPRVITGAMLNTSFVSGIYCLYTATTSISNGSMNYIPINDAQFPDFGFNILEIRTAIALSPTKLLVEATEDPTGDVHLILMTTTGDMTTGGMGNAGDWTVTDTYAYTAETGLYHQLTKYHPDPLEAGTDAIIMTDVFSATAAYVVYQGGSLL